MRPALPLLLVFTALSFLSFGEEARAQDPASEPKVVTPEQRAEAERLSDDLEKLAKRQVWSGVEKKYKELVATGVDVALEDHLYGAYAARELGDVESAYDRLQAAAKLGGSKEIVDWLWDIDHNYGVVSLSMVPPRSCELAVADMPLDPNQRKAVEAAMRAVKSECTYVGMLPKGDYQFAGMKFTVEPGFSVKVEVNPKVRKNGPIEPVIRWPNVPGSPGGAGNAGAGTTTSPSSPTPTSPAPTSPNPQE